MPFASEIMSYLRELQHDVMRAILDGADEASLAVRGRHGGERLRVYANTARVNFTGALRSSYPVIERLVGNAYFLQCATAYPARFPSRSGDLQPAGAAFPAFLAELHGAGEYRYLADVARFEWLCQETLLSADHRPLDLCKLALVPIDTYDSLRFRLAPSARLFESAYPCHAIWQANVDRSTEPEVIDLERGGDRLLLLRTAGDLTFLSLSASDWHFLRALLDGAGFITAVELAQGVGDFDPAGALQRFVATQVIVDFQ